MLKRLFPKRESLGLKPQLHLTGLDYALYAKATRVIEREANLEFGLTDFLRESLRLYEDYLLVTHERKGHYKRHWDSTKKPFPVIDFPSAEGKLTTTCTLSDNNRQRVEKLRKLAGLDSHSEVLKRAIIFYSNMILESHYGWSHLRFAPDDPNGGQPIFDGGESTDLKVINMADYFPNANSGNREAATAQHLEF